MLRDIEPSPVLIVMVTDPAPAANSMLVAAGLSAISSIHPGPQSAASER